MREISTELQKLYNSTQWKKLRHQIRTERKLCERCTREGRVEAGQSVHHLEDFMVNGRPDPILFYRGPFELLCPRCHRIADGQEGPLVKGWDAAGNPIDKRHPWWTPPDLSKPQPAKPGKKRSRPPNG